MPALFIVLGIAVVVFIAAAGHQKHPVPHRSHSRATAVVELDRGMPPSVVAQVLSALGSESDPARLDALGSSLEAYYPLSAGELRTRAMTLRARDATSSTTALPAATAPAALPPAREHARQPGGDQPWPTGAPTARDLDVATVLQAAMRALVEETDPVVLDGFAESIRAPYPAAAEMLSARALALRASAPVAAAVEGSAPASAGPMPATSSAATSLSPSPSLESQS